MIIEHRTFRSAAGTDEQALLDADRRVQTEVAPFQHGFVRRTTARGVDGAWLVETLWFDEASARAAAAEPSPAADALAALTEEGSEQVVRWTTLD